ncbi:MAG: YihY family inner membrane protein [Gemmatimonadales bacterium]|nr:YihY family inner membrane protein [Gemmatimonadales bacterium]
MEEPTPHLSWLQTAGLLAVRTVRDSLEDRLPGLAAELAFYTVFSLPPLLLVLLGAAGYVADALQPVTAAEIQVRLVEWAGTFLTADTVGDVVAPAIDQFFRGGRADLLSVGIILTIWSASRAARVVINAVRIAYDLEHVKRPFWRRTLLGFAMTVSGIVAGAFLLPLLVVGPGLGGAIAGEGIFAAVWRAVYWPVVALGGIAALTWMYNLIPPVKTPFRRDLPGAMLALASWLAGSWGLRLYAQTSIEANSAYGAFAAPLVVLTWVYVTAVAFLLGAELNAEIEKMWPTAGEPRPADE